eukprot:803949-Pelagomonas_calceolata.AAC.5
MEYLPGGDVMVSCSHIWPACYCGQARAVHSKMRMIFACWWRICQAETSDHASNHKGDPCAFVGCPLLGDKAYTSWWWCPHLIMLCIASFRLPLIVQKRVRKCHRVYLVRAELFLGLTHAPGLHQGQW